MKKILLFSSVLFCAFIINAQSFDKKDVYINAGFGLGGYNYGYSYGFTLPLVANIDKGVSDYVSVGAYVGYWSARWDYLLSGSYRFKSLHLGIRGSFHFMKLVEEEFDLGLLNEKFDVYITPWLGYNIRSATWDGTGGGFSDLKWKNRVQSGAQLGVRYFPKENIGFFTEWGGTPTSYSNWGITFRF